MLRTNPYSIRAPRAPMQRMPRSRFPTRVVVVGAGLAGLACAYELARAGAWVIVLEARDRVGGRVVSYDHLADGAIVEAGGEFIGRNHARWIHFARLFHLPLVETSGYERRPKPLVLDGVRLPFAESERIRAEVETLVHRLCIPAALVDAEKPWTTPHAEALDARSLGDWIAEQSDLSSDTRRVAALQLSSDNGVHVDRQSLLGNLAMIKGGGLDAFWHESEWFRCARGNQALAREFADILGDRLRLGMPVESIERSADGMVVTACGETFNADDVVLATPASIYAKIRFTPALPAALRVQMGSAKKYLISVKSRFWNNEACAPDGLSDGLVTQTWDATDGQSPRSGAVMTAFCAGTSSQVSLDFGRD